MARPGISFANVVAAANQLLGQGKSPTIEQIRLVLGTGSSTTIAMHLREWKAQQETQAALPSKEAIPQEFISLMRGLWQRVLNHAEGKVATIQQSSEEFMAQFKLELANLKRENTQWQHKYNELLQLHKQTQDNFKHSHTVALQQQLLVIKELKQQNKKLTLELTQAQGKLKRMQATKR